MNIIKLDPVVVSSDANALKESLSAIRDYVTEASQLAGLEKDAMYRLKLAVDEISANIIMYGYNDNGLSGNVVASAIIDDEFLTITLEDSAVPYDIREKEAPSGLDDPLDTREIGGLGIFLALKNIDKFHYEWLNDKNVNRFSMKCNPGGSR